MNKFEKDMLKVNTYLNSHEDDEELLPVIQKYLTERNLGFQVGKFDALLEGPIAEFMNEHYDASDMAHFILFECFTDRNDKYLVVNNRRECMTYYSINGLAGDMVMEPGYGENFAKYLLENYIKE